MSFLLAPVEAYILNLYLLSNVKGGLWFPSFIYPRARASHNANSLSHVFGPGLATMRMRNRAANAPPTQPDLIPMEIEMPDEQHCGTCGHFRYRFSKKVRDLPELRGEPTNEGLCIWEPYGPSPFWFGGEARLGDNEGHFCDAWTKAD